MTRYLYFCPKCYFLGSAEHKDPRDYQKCDECKGAMIYTGLIKAEWDQKSPEEKEQIKSKLKSDYAPNADDNGEQLRLLRKMNGNIEIVKNIIVAWAALTVIGGLLAILL